MADQGQVWYLHYLVITSLLLQLSVFSTSVLRELYAAEHLQVGVEPRSHLVVLWWGRHVVEVLNVEVVSGWSKVGKLVHVSEVAPLLAAKV